MTKNRPDPELDTLRGRLEALKAAIHEQMRAYPTPIAGCDQQFNHLLEQRDRVFRELARLDGFSDGHPAPDGYAGEVALLIGESGFEKKAIGVTVAP